MASELYLEQAVESLPDTVQKTGHQVAHAMHDAALAGGRPARVGMDILHGTWLGHPLHAAISDIPVGAWILGGAFDIAAEITGDRRARWAGDTLLMIGTIAAVPTAMAGMADYSVLPKKATKTAALHGVLNGLGMLLCIGSIIERRRGRRSSALALSLPANVLTIFTAWLGGMLVYKHKVGVDHAERFDEPETWTPVLDEADLPDRTPRRIDVDGKGVLLYREDGRIYAVGAVCAHAGGPLEEGDIKHGCVQCPWHDSVYDLRDGRNIHGPSTRPQPAFDARARDGRIELRLRQA